MMVPVLIPTLTNDCKAHPSRGTRTICQHAEVIDPHAQDDHRDENEASGNRWIDFHAFGRGSRPCVVVDRRMLSTTPVAFLLPSSQTIG